jgi:hypothetical protein
LIYAQLFDGGTEFSLQPGEVTGLVGGGPYPGLDRVWWVNGRIFEESVFDYGARRNTAEQNAMMMDTDDREVRKWTAGLPSHMWIDLTDRYEWTGADGFLLNAYHVDRIQEDFPPLIEGDMTIDTAPEDPELDRSAGRIVRELNYQEIQDIAVDPFEWTRLPTLNEIGGTRLMDPVAMIIPDVRGSIALELPDNSLFDPFDLREGLNRYFVTDDDGNILAFEPGDGGEELLYLNPRGTYRLHFRPRRWKYFVIVWAQFLYVSFLEMFFVRQTFTQVWYDRPPVYPLRHNLIKNSGCDPATNYQFEQSQAAADLTDQIFDAQWWSLSEAMIFHHIELVQMWIERAAPRRDEIVLTIEEVDTATGNTSRRHIRNKHDLSSIYPTVDVSFCQEVPWYLLPPGV